MAFDCRDVPKARWITPLQPDVPKARPYKRIPINGNQAASILKRREAGVYC